MLQASQPRVKIPIVTIADSILVGWGSSDLLDWRVLDVVNQSLRHDLLPTSDKRIAHWRESTGCSERRRDKGEGFATNFVARCFPRKSFVMESLNNAIGERELMEAVDQLGTPP
jgi:hypothetical protein